MQVRDLGWGFAATLALSACATQPPATDGASAEPMAQVAAAPAIETVDTPTANEQQPAQVDGADAGNDGPPPGWRVIKSKGETLWCSPRPPTGTRLPSRKGSCVTPDEYWAAKTQGKDWLMESVRRSIETKPAG